MKIGAQKCLRKELLELGIELSGAVPDTEYPDINKLQKQTQLLDKIMLRMLSNADYNGDTDLTQYSIALRAQNQYHQTLLAKNVLERREEKEPRKQIKYTHPQTAILDMLLADKVKKRADLDDQTEQITS
jgi:hypothetical protein